jgi:hypothetical protein
MAALSMQGSSSRHTSRRGQMPAYLLLIRVFSAQHQALLLFLQYNMQASTHVPACTTSAVGYPSKGQEPVGRGGHRNTQQRSKVVVGHCCTMSPSLWSRAPDSNLGCKARPPQTSPCTGGSRSCCHGSSPLQQLQHMRDHPLMLHPAPLLWFSCQVV